MTEIDSDRTVDGVLDAWPQVTAPLRGAGWSDDAIEAWLTAPNGSLGGRSPLAALEAGEHGPVLTEVVRHASASIS